MTAPERYGRRRIDRMLREWQALREAVASGDPEATQAAFDACVEWVDFAFGAARTPTAEVWALVEALREMLQIQEGLPMTGIEAGQRADRARAAVAAWERWRG